MQVAIVGPSGAGKSTLASLLFRFYNPISGVISYDGMDIQTLHLSEMRGQMALVPQEVILYSGSIEENISYGKPSATHEEVVEAARKANALEFIERFPDKFNTIVGERGIQLSGGQRQRIAIARAVLKDPSILILDEATSSLDSESERLVQEALEKLMHGRTSFVIAHRLSTVKKADIILVIENGNLVEAGKHEQLVSNENGLYKKLSSLQFVNN
jgi:ABC-type multidrug transport system fused ATPase/permease subunit